MIRIALLATALCIATGAMAAPASHPAAAAPTGSNNNVHPIPPGAGGDRGLSNANGTDAAQPSSTSTTTSSGGSDGFHNTVHPIPPGQGGDSGDTTDTASRKAAQPSTSAGGSSSGGSDGWHNTVHPIPAGGGSTQAASKTHRHRHVTAKPPSSTR